MNLWNVRRRSASAAAKGRQERFPRVCSVAGVVLRLFLFATAIPGIRAAEEAGGVLPAPQRVFRVESEVFELVSEKGEVGAALALEIRDVEAVTQTLLELTSDPGRRIVVRIEPETSGPQVARAPALARSSAGLVSLDLPRNLRSEDRLAYLFRAVLLRHLGSTAAVERLPEWFVVGGVESIRARSLPGLAVSHARRVLAEELPGAGSVLSGATGMGRSQAYLVVRCLAGAASGRQRLTRFVEAVAQSGDARGAFLIGFGDLPEMAAGAGAFWQTQILGLARSLAGSSAQRDWRSRVVALGIVEVEREGAPIWMGAEELWGSRRERWLRQLVERRLLEVRILLTEAPPLWFNPVLSAGQAWEALKGTDEARFLEAWNRVAVDVGFATRLEGEIRASVATWEAKLSRGQEPVAR